jgi:signal transduction histidine kinase/ActR/RegA family two-component response regulator
MAKRTELGLQAKLVVASTLATALVVGLAFVGLRLETRRLTEGLYVDALARSERTIAALQSERMQDLLWTAGLVATNPTLRAAMETYRDESAAGHEATRAQLLTTVQRAVENGLASLDHDLLLVTGPDGRVIAAAARGAAAPGVGLDLSDVPAVKTAIDPNATVGPRANALLEIHGEPFQVGCTPIELDGYPIGALVVGDRLAGTFVERLAAAFDGSVVVATPQTIVASTFRGRLTAADLPVGQGAALAGATESTIEVGGETLAFAALPLGTDSGGRPVVLYLLDSVTQRLAPAEAATRGQFLLYGSLVVLLVGVAAATLSRRFLRPLGDFVEFVRSVAGSRDYSVRFDSRAAGPEIETLNDSYDSLIASLERERAELVKRSTELAQANEALWSQMQERERIQHALEESEKQLRQSQKLEAVGTLAGGVAHDFNNLLTVIIGHSQLMFDEMDSADPRQKDLTEIRAAADRAAALTRQLLAFSRKQVLKPKTVDVVTVVQGMDSLLRRLIGEDIDLRVGLPPDPAWVLADPSQLEQVLLNLAVNARDAMPHGGRLAIEVGVIPASLSPAITAQEGLGLVELVVRDTGVGMDDWTRERVFEPFFSTKGPGKGTGLGLSTVYGIVEQSGGQITIESAPARGAVFRVRLPEVAPATTEAEVALAPAAAGPGGTETILLVEDEADVRRLAARALVRSGYVVLEAAGGVEALEICRRHRGPIDLVLTDVIMPGLNGNEVYARLVEIRPQARALFMSGYPADIVANRGLLSPRTGFLQKPFTPAALVQQVRLALDGQVVVDAVA